MTSKPNASFHTYIAELTAAVKQGNATEHTHRPALKMLVQALGKDILATNEPKRIKCGAPDFIVTHNHVPLGYIEAKDLGTDLDETENDEQLTRYRASLRNLILTDYNEFRLYRNGDPVQSARLGVLNAKQGLKGDPEGIKQVQTLLTWFLQADTPSISSPRELAERMARIAQLIRDLIRRTFAQEGTEGELHGQYAAFRKVLLADLQPTQFADMYAQTLCYGLFAARCNHEGPGFTREHAASELPRTNPFLRRLFSQVAGVDLDERISWAVDDLAELLRRADMASVLEDFGKATRQEDPVVHFYETFLAAYDPKERERRGVYYTPEPVVSYIVRSIHELLRQDFSIPLGLADSSKITIKRPTKLKKDGTVALTSVETHRVQILDPATGTGTFLYFVIDQIREVLKSNRGLWRGYVAEHLLPRLFGFELLMAPYAVAHMKLGLELKESGYDFASDERLRVFLTNTLEEAHELSDLPLFAQWLSQEAASASEIKKNAPIMVVLGNPPYSGHSANKGKWIHNLLRGRDTLTKRATHNYFEVDGKPLGEKQPKWLNDDYVKFIRFAQWRIEQTGYGILGFITNHGYLDNPTFRGMRESLLKSFNQIYVLDLHGSTKKKERNPEGGTDANVFDIQQGVAIALFVKDPRRSSKVQVHHSHLWGSRPHKYSWLLENDVTTTKWKKLSPASPSYLFVPQDAKLLDEYSSAQSIREIFPEANNGVLTSRDHFVVGFDFDEIVSRMHVFLDDALTDREVKEKLELSENYQWRVSQARVELKRVKGDLKTFDNPYLYRPFDVRRILFHPSVVWRMREETMRHMLGRDNLALATTRHTEIGRGWEHAFCSQVIMDHHAVSLKEINYLFPLYLLPSDAPDLLEQAAPRSAVGRRVNLSQTFLASLSRGTGLRYVSNSKGDLKKTFGPEDAFHYIYAVLYSPTYRSRYAEYLRRDFPRIPLTTKASVFRSLCDHGSELTSLHLMRSSGSISCTYPVTGNNRVDRIEFKNGRVQINAEQYFDGVPNHVWTYSIGGYQIAMKWLKDRKNRKLSHDDCVNYMQIVSAIEKTIRIQKAIDNSIGEWPIR